MEDASDCENIDEIDSLKRELEITNYRLNLVEGKSQNMFHNQKVSIDHFL